MDGDGKLSDDERQLARDAGEGFPLGHKKHCKKGKKGQRGGAL